MAKRSTTDWITTEAIFPEDVVDELFQLINSSASIPPAFLPTFLHEATHHWCFTSTVGTAIAILAIRGRVSGFRAIETDSPDEASWWERRAAEDIITAEVATLLLRPLAEGMASFAELDLTLSTQSTVVPPPLRWAATFAAREGLLTGSADTYLQRRYILTADTMVSLVSARKQMRHVKEALLTEPMSCQESDGYLAGYLTIKSLWRLMQANNSRYCEPELFLLKIYDFFYEDLDLVPILFDSTQPLTEKLTSITEHFAKRLEACFEDAQNASSLAQFLASLSPKPCDEAQSAEHPLPVPHSQIGEPSARFESIWHATTDDAVRAATDDNRQEPLNECVTSPSLLFARLCFLAGKGRDLLELGRRPVQLRVEAIDTDVYAKGEFRTRISTVDQSFLGETNGMLYLLLNIRSGERVIAAASSEFKLIALSTFHGVLPPDEDYTRHLIISRIGGPAMAETMILNNREALSRHREIRRIDGYLEQARQLLDSMYGPAALALVPDDKLEDLIPKVMTGGIFGALDFDANAIRALAIIGSTAHRVWIPEDLQSELEKSGVDYESAMKALRECALTTNLFVLLEEESGIRCNL